MTRMTDEGTRRRAGAALLRSVSAGGLLLAALALQGCGESTQQQAPTMPARDARAVRTIETEPEPASPDRSGAAAQLAKIAETDDVFDLIELENEIMASETQPAEVREALRQRKSALADELSLLGSVSDEADLYAKRYTRIGDGAYRLDLLFKAVKPFEKDLRIAVIGLVDEAHKEIVESEHYKQYGSDRWNHDPVLPTTQWEQGRFVPVSIEMRVQDIPYNLFVRFYEYEGSKWHGEGSFGLGWMADVEQ